VKVGLLVKAGGLALAARRLLLFAGPGSGSGAESAGGGAIAGGSMLSAGAAKLGVTALCVAGAAGSFAVCSQVGVLPSANGKVSQHARHRHDGPAARHAATAAAAPAGRRTTLAAPATPSRQAPTSPPLGSRAPGSARCS
jgi:hypothetical protein